MSTTNLERLRAVTEHCRCYPDLAETLSTVSISRPADLLVFGDTSAETVRAFLRWAVSMEATEVCVRAVGAVGERYHLESRGYLAGGSVAEVATVIREPAALIADGIEHGMTVTVDRLATVDLTEVPGDVAGVSV